MSLSVKQDILRLDVSIDDIAVMKVLSKTGTQETDRGRRTMSNQIQRKNRCKATNEQGTTQNATIFPCSHVLRHLGHLTNSNLCNDQTFLGLQNRSTMAADEMR